MPSEVIASYKMYRNIMNTKFIVTLIPQNRSIVFVSNQHKIQSKSMEQKKAEIGNLKTQKLLHNLKIQTLYVNKKEAC